MNVPLLAQIPLVQSICESGDQGEPAALETEGITGKAFAQLAKAVVRETERRNQQLPPTEVVAMKK